MKIYARKMLGNSVHRLEVDQDLGIEIWHNGQAYSLDTDPNGTLVLRSIQAVQLIVLPKGSNTVEIRAEG